MYTLVGSGSGVKVGSGFPVFLEGAQPVVAGPGAAGPVKMLEARGFPDDSLEGGQPPAFQIWGGFRPPVGWNVIHRLVRQETDQRHL